MLLLVTALRLSHLDDVGMWEDEALSYFLSLGNRRMIEMTPRLAGRRLTIDTNLASAEHVGEVLDTLRRYSPYGPSYYLLLHATIRLTGARRPVLLKLWNVFFGTITAAFLWLLARRGLSVTGAALALLLYAFSPWDLSVSLQLKAYSLATTCVVASTYFLWQLASGRSTGTWKTAVAYGVIVAIGLMSHVFTLLILPLHAGFLLARARSRPASLALWSAGGVLAAVLVLPWFFFAARSQIAFESKQAAVEPNAEYLGIAAMTGNLRSSFTTNYLPFSAPAAGSGSQWAAATLLLAVLLFGTSGLTAVNSGARGLARLCGLVALAPWACAAVFSVVARSGEVLWPRYFVMFLPCGWLAIAAGVDACLGRFGAARARSPSPPSVGTWGPSCAVLTAVVVFGLWQEAALRAHGPLDRYLDWRKVSHVLEAEVDPQALIVHAPGDSAFLAFTCYWRGPNPQTVLAAATSRKLRRIAAAADHRTIWFLLTRGRQRLRPSLEAELLPLGYRPAASLRVDSLVALRFDPVADDPLIAGR